MKIIFFIFYISFMLSGCGLAVKEIIVDNYYLVAPDVDEQLSIGMATSYNDVIDILILPTVYEIGNNKRFIIAKQHPENNKNITNYFIIDILNKDGHKSSVIGPLTYEQYIYSREKLNVPEEITFTNIKK